MTDSAQVPVSELPSSQLTARDSLVTLQSHILAEETKYPGASGTFSWILSALSISAKIISSKIRRARLEDVLGDLGEENVQGESQQKLDVIADEVLIRTLAGRAGVAIVASEENDDPLVLRSEDCDHRRYCVLFDPLDGSSNLDVAGGVGTIFSVLREDRRVEDPKSSLLQPGREQVAAGYILYGSSTVFTLTTGTGVQMFVLDPTVGAFLRVSEDLRIPESKNSYSLNEGNRQKIPQGYRDYLDAVQADDYSSRYAGAMVADIHRILLKGGVFMYPPTEKAPKGKLRLMYEANPMAFLMEQAGGLASTGEGRIMDVEPEEIHQRVPVVMGSSREVERVLSHLG